MLVKIFQNKKEIEHYFLIGVVFKKAKDKSRGHDLNKIPGNI
jgi:hypothetical protein